MAHRFDGPPPCNKLHCEWLYSNSKQMAQEISSLKQRAGDLQQQLEACKEAQRQSDHLRMRAEKELAETRKVCLVLASPTCMPTGAMHSRVSSCGIRHAPAHARDRWVGSRDMCAGAACSSLQSQHATQEVAATRASDAARASAAAASAEVVRLATLLKRRDADIAALRQAESPRSQERQKLNVALHEQLGESKRVLMAMKTTHESTVRR